MGRRNRDADERSFLLTLGLIALTAYGIDCLGRAVFDPPSVDADVVK